MNRKDFFKKLGLGALVAFTAPKLLADDLNYSEISNGCFNSSRHKGITDTFKNGGWYSRHYLTDHCHGEEWHYNGDPCTKAQIEALYQMQKQIDDEIFWGVKL